MTARQLLDQGKVREASKFLSTYLRESPGDRTQRTFLFELLCFSGEYDRAGKQLSVLSKDGGQSELGAVLYYSALHAERTRHDLFKKGGLPRSSAQGQLGGTLNGKQFSSISDADSAIGSRLEAFAAGAYVWIPFEHIESVYLQAPEKLRDTLWIPAHVKTGPRFKGADMGEVLLPAIYPFSWKSDDESVWLGHSTEWVSDEGGDEFPVGQKMIVIDGESIPLLEVRSLEFANAAAG